MNLHINNSDAIKEVRKIAKQNGMTFKTQNSKINGTQAYQFIDRETGIVKGSNFTVWTAYENCMSGYIDTINN